MLEDPIAVVIGGKTWLCPPMSFYCLERAWPHIRRLSVMGGYNQALAAAQLQVKMAATPAEHDSATQNVATALALIEAEDADFVGQTRVTLHVIVAALALETPPPSYDQLARMLQPDEIGGIHIACAALMDGSGLMRGGTAPGEPPATSRTMPAHLNGTGSSPN
jgi:hypothetical protein